MIGPPSGNIAVTGPIKLYKGEPEIVLERAEQLTRQLEALRNASRAAVSNDAETGEDFMLKEKRSRICIAAVASTLVSAIAPDAIADQSADAKQIVGHWYGVGRQPPHSDAHWIDDFRADGTYTMTTEPGSDCSKRSSNSGTWSFTAGVLTMQTTSADGKAFAKPPAPHTYRMNKLTADEMVFVSDQTATTYDIQRVSAAFHLPTCKAS